MPNYRGRSGKMLKHKPRRKDGLYTPKNQRIRSSDMYRRECKSFVDKPVSIPTTGLKQLWFDGWDEPQNTNGEIHGRNEQG